jgi:hypothetical protein
MTDADAARLEGFTRRRSGDLAGAAAAFAAAADQYRREGQSDAALDGLVGALCDCGDTLAGLGDWQGAAARASEAVDVLSRRAMLGEGAVPSPQAARALLVKGTAELRIGAADATQDIDAAVEMARRVALALPTDRNRALLATALHEGAVLARAAERPDDAVASAAESATIWRDLAASGEERFAQPLAAALSTLAIEQAAHGDDEAAVESALAACGVLRPLADAGDVNAAAKLAAAETTAAKLVGDLASLDLAERIGLSAVRRYEWLTGRHRPPAFVPELAHARFILATCVAGLGAFETAASLCHDALAVLVEHAGMLPAADLFPAAEIMGHYQVFAAECGAEMDQALIDAAGEALDAI